MSPIIAVAGVLKVSHLGVALDGLLCIGDLIDHIFEPMAGMEGKHTVDGVDYLPVLVLFGQKHSRPAGRVRRPVIPAQFSQRHHQIGIHLRGMGSIAVPEHAPHSREYRPVGIIGMKEKVGAAQAAEQFTDAGLHRVFGFL